MTERQVFVAEQTRHDAVHVRCRVLAESVAHCCPGLDRGTAAPIDPLALTRDAADLSARVRVSRMIPVAIGDPARLARGRPRRPTWRGDHGRGNDATKPGRAPGWRPGPESRLPLGYVAPLRDGDASPLRVGRTPAQSTGLTDSRIIRTLSVQKHQARSRPYDRNAVSRVRPDARGQEGAA